MKHFLAQIILGFLIFTSNQASAQSPPPVPELKYIPSVMPKSPDAAAISRYGSYEVNLFTGLPNISIPLYEIKVGGLSVPISINYHAGGNKVSDMSSWIGLGWSLSSSGSINRRVMGRPDELSGGYLNGAPIVKTSMSPYDANDLYYLSSILSGSTDSEPDIYSYSVPGRSGKFLFKQNNQAILLPVSPLAINRIQLQNAQNFEIKDESGISYDFSTSEYTQASNTSRNDASHTWWLTKMVSPNLQDTIKFNYTPRAAYSYTSYTSTETYVIDDLINNTPGYSVFQQSPGQYNTNTVYSATSWQTISEILFKEGKVVFEQGYENREDLIANYDAPKRLAAIKIYQFDNLLNGYKHLRTIRFYQSYFVNPVDLSKRLRLDSVHITNTAETEGLKFRFSYNTTVSLPEINSTSKDFWGYFNNANNVNIDNSSMKTLIPRTTFNYQPSTEPGAQVFSKTIGSQDPNGRDPNPLYMQAYMLNGIVFPTGGSSTFEYETNKYLDEQGNIKYAGGLRVKAIKSYDDAGSISFQKEYKYGVGESGLGRANFVLNHYYFKNQSNYWYWGNAASCPTVQGTKRVTTFFANSSMDLEPSDGAPVVYPEVTEYSGTTSVNTGKTVYEFSDQPDGLNTLGPYGRGIITSYHFNRGKLLKKIEFKSQGQGQYSKVTSTGNIYRAQPEQFHGSMGMVVFKARVNQSAASQEDYCAPTPGNCGCYDDFASYLYMLYSIRTADDKLIATTDTIFDANNQAKYFHTYKRFSYDNTVHWQPTFERTLTNVSDTLIVSKKYNPEYTNGVYPSMTSAHIYDKLIEEESFLQTSSGNKPINKITTNYSAYSGNNFLPSSIMQSKGGFSNETRLYFSSYDNRGNLLQMNKASDITTSYIWDYRMMKPTAEIRNASLGDVAFTSFEAQSQGNWSYSGVVVTDGSAPTGKRVYLLSSGAITKTELSSGSVYVVSYWNNTGSPYYIPGTQGQVLEGRSVNGWRYYEHKITGQYSISISGSGLVDELRFYPDKAQMTSMTYEPLVGISSVCDANSKILYYEYDELGRLILIRDSDRNIVKKICYNYWQQNENCNIYYNTAQSASFTRNTCPSGSTGNSATYTVPAGTYVSTVSQADANSKALADVFANGQNYANALATCNSASVLIKGFNAKSSTYNIKFTNTETGSAYTFFINPYTYNPYNIGYIPAGTYNVQFYPGGSPATATFAFNGYSQYAYGGAIFYNVSITSQSQASIY